MKYLNKWRLIYLKLIRINDSPLKISLGLAIGVFTGIIPGIGPIAALVLAVIFRVNRAASLLGSLLTNTWLSITTFLLAIKIGSAVMGLRQQEVFIAWANFLKDFHFLDLFKLSVSRIIFPVIAGYFIIALCAGLTVYLASLLVLSRMKRRRAGYGKFFL